MVEKSHQTGKLFYSIGEVAKMFNVNTSLIRFWEKEFDIIQPKKNKKGNRLFTQSDVDNFHIIFHLAKERGYTLQGVKSKLKEHKKEESFDNFEIIKTLKNLKEFLLEIKGEL
jgi:DNA-binding transcriptional MerR regulator